MPDEPWTHDPDNIDLRRLDWEAWRQSKLVRRYGELAASAKKHVNDAKSDLDLVEAQLTLECRINPTEFNLPEGKTTEAVYKAAVLTHQRYQDAERLLNQVKHDADVMAAMMNALHDKRYMIQEERELIQMQYRTETPEAPFSAPRAREAARTGAQEAARRPLPPGAGKNGKKPIVVKKRA